MNKIITIGREFGSGGRELGRRLAEKLRIPYYDQEIVRQLAERTEFAEEYIRQVDESATLPLLPVTVGRSFSPQVYPAVAPALEVYIQQSQLIRELAERAGCVIVGRCADHILKDMRPFRIFAYSDMQHKVLRCRERGGFPDNMTDKALEQHIRTIDKKRSKYYRQYTGMEWGEKSNYDLCVNTSYTDMEAIVCGIAGIIGDK